MDEDYFDKEGNRLRQALKNRRKELNMSQDELCRKMGRARTFVSKYELGERALSFPEVLELCRLLNLNEQEFIDSVKGNVSALDAAGDRDSASCPASTVSSESRASKSKDEAGLEAADSNGEADGNELHA